MCNYINHILLFSWRFLNFGTLETAINQQTEPSFSVLPIFKSFFENTTERVTVLNGCNFHVFYQWIWCSGASNCLLWAEFKFLLFFSCCIIWINLKPLDMQASVSKLEWVTHHLLGDIQSSFDMRFHSQVHLNLYIKKLFSYFELSLDFHLSSAGQWCDMGFLKHMGMDIMTTFCCTWCSHLKEQKEMT